MNTELLKTLGISFGSSSLLEEAYQKYRGLAMLPLTTSMQVLILDLDNLPTKPLPFKEVFIRWLLQVNEGRLINEEEPLLTYNIAKMCPIWKIIKMPVKSAGMNKQGLIKPPKLVTKAKQTTPKAINKGKS